MSAAIIAFPNTRLQALEARAEQLARNGYLRPLSKWLWRGDLWACEQAADWIVRNVLLHPPAKYAYSGEEAEEAAYRALQAVWGGEA
jgi:hypothetical protein